MSARARRRVVLALIALVAACIGVASQVALVDDLTPDANSPLYAVPTEKPQVLLNAHDGQFFAALGLDPLLRHPDRIGPEVAQRASRPLFAWVAGLLALGGRERIAWTLMILTVLSITALVVSVSAVADSFGRDGGSWLVLASLAAPGVVALIAFPGLSDALGASLALFGLAAWGVQRHGVALALFAAAGLCHEALLVFPAAVLAHELLTERQLRTRWVAAGAPYLAWTTFVRVRVGQWPSASSRGNLGLPFDGLVTAARTHWHPLDVVCVVVIVLAGVVVWTHLREAVFRLVIVGFAGVAVVLGSNIWTRWVDFGRVLLPVCALAVVAIVPELQTTARTESVRT